MRRALLRGSSMQAKVAKAKVDRMLGWVKLAIRPVGAKDKVKLRKELRAALVNLVEHTMEAKVMQTQLKAAKGTRARAKEIL
mmetsp:Transcript_15335/g.28329  ORF Transcript_15335/g.28329 Transcript_15335/m.28329 type:complete len:82 (-) Transcript_15335:239-484(-)